MIVISGFFSGSETAMMVLNRYRMRHLAKQGHRGARRVLRMLAHPDRLLGLILLGNNFVNFFAATLSAVIGSRLLGDIGLAASPFVLTPLILILAELAPKTVATLYPERIAYPASFLLYPLGKLLYPFTAIINYIANKLLASIGIRADGTDREQLSTEELRTVVMDPRSKLSSRYRKMLTSVLDLERVTVVDIMVPRNAIIGIDLDDEPQQIIDRLRHSQHSRLPLYRNDINHIEAVLHLRRIMELPQNEHRLAEYLLDRATEPYFVPASTSLNAQLRNFQHQQRRLGLIVDEYGDIHGLVTLDDLLGEIVGEFTADTADRGLAIHPQPDGTYLIDGATNVRELNREMQWELPTDGPKTLNGLVLEQLESIPDTGISLRIAGYPVEIVQVTNNAVKIARIKPALYQPTAATNR